MKRIYLTFTILIVSFLLFSQAGFAASARKAPATSLEKKRMEAFDKPASSADKLNKKDIKRNHKLAHKKAKLNKKLAKLKKGKNGRRYSERGLLALSIGFLVAGIVLLVIDVSLLRVLGVIAILASIAFFVLWLLDFAGHV